ncbi:MAG TPA: hypothetical protein VN757_12125, partial [Steroidobacteraceae bacterium]|nr:hypothetical protein [Steroidobacteraceae bacterium]
MTPLEALSSTEVTLFAPEKARINQAIYDAGIELAARLGDMGALERWIDEKLDHQEGGVQWWRANVRRAGGDRTIVAESATILTVAQAERILKYDKQTISKWRHKLGKRAEYREAISKAARKKLELEKADNHRARGTGENEW